MKAFWIGVAALGVAALGACKGSDSTGPGTSGVNGIWKFQELLSAPSFGLTCADSATVNLTQNGQAFSGTYSQTGICSANGQTAPNDGTGAISNGRVSGDSVFFNEESCSYSGTTTGSPVTRMTGAVICPDTSTGTLVNIGGSWIMTR